MLPRNVEAIAESGTESVGNLSNVTSIFYHCLVVLLHFARVSLHVVQTHQCAARVVEDLVLNVLLYFQYVAVVVAVV